MATFGLIGYPLGHSQSRQFFTDKFLQTGNLYDRFFNFPIASIDELESVFNAYPDLKGLAVTIPYKQEVIAALHEIDPLAREVGAVNCIQILEGVRKGFNTDVVGIEASLLEWLGASRPDALILGTGGAAQAVAFVLKKLGIRFCFVSRQAKSDNMINYEMIDAHTMVNHPLVINCSPVGMYPRLNDCPILPYESVTSDHYFFDLIYNPQETLFLSKAKQSGARTMNGERMFLLQAEENWRIWNNGLL